jgi:cytochrome P450
MKGLAGPITTADIMIEDINILGAGADATSIAILTCLGDLVMNPGSVPKLQKEIGDAYDKLCLGRGNNISYTEAARLPCLTSFIKESMRLHP